MSPEMIRDVERIGRLMDDEAELRGVARQIELNPTRSEEAARLFRRADGVRRQRLELLSRCGLTR